MTKGELVEAIQRANDRATAAARESDGVLTESSTRRGSAHSGTNAANRSQRSSSGLSGS